MIDNQQYKTFVINNYLLLMCVDSATTRPVALLNLAGFAHRMAAQCRVMSLIFQQASHGKISWQWQACKSINGDTEGLLRSWLEHVLSHMETYNSFHQRLLFHRYAVPAQTQEMGKWPSPLKWEEKQRYMGKNVNAERKRGKIRALLSLLIPFMGIGCLSLFIIQDSCLQANHFHFKTVGLSDYKKQRWSPWTWKKEKKKKDNLH